MNVAVRRPERVSALILVDSLGVTVSGGGSVTPGVAQWPVIGPALAALALTSDSLVRDGLLPNFYDDSLVTDEQVASYYRPLKTRGGQRAVYLTRGQAGLDPVEPAINTIKQPTLIVWGAEDELVPPEAGRRLNSLIAGSRLVVFDKCGHLPQAEMPARFVNEVGGFITSLPQTMNQTANNP
jgi:pimeloyl-ACP methyl ester carboxylesterase